jgi:hypothetical protein
VTNVIPFEGRQHDGERPSRDGHVRASDRHRHHGRRVRVAPGAPPLPSTQPVGRAGRASPTLAGPAWSLRQAAGGSRHGAGGDAARRACSTTFGDIASRAPPERPANAHYVKDGAEIPPGAAFRGASRRASCHAPSSAEAGVVGRDPVAGDEALRPAQRDVAGAHVGVQPVLQASQARRRLRRKSRPLPRAPRGAPYGC